MEKSCNVAVGKTPCTYCGAQSSAINSNGDPVCSNHCAEKKASAGSNDTVDKMIDTHREEK